MFVFLWGMPEVKKLLDGLSVVRIPFEGLHNMIEKVPPVVPMAHKETAIYTLNWLSATGTGILLSAMVAGLAMKYSFVGLLRIYGHTIWKVRYSLITIAAMLALGYLTRYSGTDATMGLAFAVTGVFYPLLRHPAGLARRGGHRLGHRVERAVRRPAEDHRRAARPAPVPDGGGQQLGRRDGQDDRRAEHRRRLHRHQLVRARGRHPALRVLPQPGAGGAGRPGGDAAGLCLSVHRAGLLSHDRRAGTPSRAALSTFTARPAAMPPTPPEAGRPRVGLFVTCLVDAIRPQIGFAALQLLEAAGCAVEVPPAQTCCGQPAFNSGDDADAAALARRVIAAFERLRLRGAAVRLVRRHDPVHYPERWPDDPAWARARRGARRADPRDH